MSLVSRYGTPKSRTADTLERTIEAAVQFLAEKNKESRDLDIREKEYEFRRRSGIIADIRQTHGDLITIPEDAWDDDSVLASVQEEAKGLSLVKTNAVGIVPATGGSLSDFAEDAISFGGVEIIGPDGEPQTIDMDVSPFGLESHDLEVVEQWINGNSYLGGLVNRTDISIEEIAELERLGLFEPGEYTVDSWAPADSDEGTTTAGDVLRKHWSLYRNYITENKNFLDVNKYAQTESIMTTSDLDVKASLRKGDFQYAQSEQSVTNYETMFATATMNADGDAIAIGGHEFDSWSEVSEEGMTKLAAMSSMTIEQLSHYWDNQSPALLKEAKENNFLGLYNQMNGAVQSYRYMRQVDAEYDFGNLEARREGELAEGVLDRMREVQMQLDPHFADIEGRVLGGQLSYADAEKELKQLLVPLIRKYGVTGETQYNEQTGKWEAVRDPIFGVENPETQSSLLDDIFDAYFDKLNLTANPGGM
tara:strand:- start:1418 stop:2851 length:1434 start_codon:yes stop_codon:yes gene_type:complete